MCMGFCCNPQLYLSPFSQFERSHFWLDFYQSILDTGYLINYERNSYNLRWIFLELCRCFCEGLKICMTFACNPQINFCHFLSSLNLVIVLAQLLSNHIDTGYLVNATPPTIVVRYFGNLADCFVNV